MIDKIKEIVELFKRKDCLLAELRLLINEKGKELRILKDGDIVEIINTKGEVKCEGIVAGAFSWASISQPFEFFEFARKPEKFEKALHEIRYNVKAIKKDGTISERNADGRASYTTSVSRHDYYIRLKH